MKKEVSKNFVILSMVYTLCYLVSVLLEIKPIDIPLISLTTGILVVPITYILSDCITEIYGFNNTKFLILWSCIINTFFIILIQIACILPPATFWDGQEHFQYVLASTPRIAIAAILAYIFGSISNAYIMSWLKSIRYKGFKYRAIVSSIIGHTIDNITFYIIAFLFVFPCNELILLIISNIILKLCFELTILPLTNLFVEFIKNKEL